MPNQQTIVHWAFTGRIGWSVLQSAVMTRKCLTWSGRDIAHEAGKTPVESGIFVNLPSGFTLRGSSLQARGTLHTERDDATSITQHEVSNSPFASAHAHEDSQKKLNLVVNTAVCEVSDRKPGSPLLRNSTLGLQWERRIEAATVDEKPQKLRGHDSFCYNDEDRSRRL